MDCFSQAALMYDGRTYTLTFVVDPEVKMLDNTIHKLRYSPADIRSTFQDGALRDIINTEAFRRLQSIHFLGSIDFITNPSARGVEDRHTRFDHSLAVGSLALQFTRALDLPENDQRTIVAAALLHDIGHAPLSHSLEPALKSAFELDHHIIGERILRGEVRLGLKLVDAFQRWNINNVNVMCLIAGVGDGIGRELFSRSINVDTIEGITRSATYIYRRPVVMNPVSIIDALVRLGVQSQDLLDDFWTLKNEVYSKLIQSRTGLLADFICKRYVENNVSSFDSSYYYGKDSELRSDHSYLFEALHAFGRRGIISPEIVRDGEDMSFKRREFFIDKSVVLKKYRDLDRRYLQRKFNVCFTIRKKGGDDAHQIYEHRKSEDLF